MFWKFSVEKGFGVFAKGIGSAIVFGLFAVGAFYLSHYVTAYLLGGVKIGLFLFHRFLGMLLFVFFITINLGNIVVSFSTLYRSPEVEFLLTHPVTYQNIFVIKFLDNFFYSSGTLFLVGFSVLLGYGTYFHYPWYFYPFMMFGILVPFMFLAGCIAVLVLLGVMILAEKINFRLLIGIIVAFYLMQVFLYFKVSGPVHLVREVMKYYPYVDLYFGTLDPLAIKLLPNFWISEILYFFSIKNYFPVYGYTALLLLSTLGVFILLLLVGGMNFFRTWLTSLTIKAMGMKRVELRSNFFAFGRKSIFSSQIEVLLKKEFWQFVREPSQWIHFTVMMVLITAFLSSVSTLNIKLESPELMSVVYLVIFIFNIFLINSLALRFGFPMMSLEGKAMWSMRSAPIKLSNVYWIKFSLTTLLILLLGGVIAFFSNIPNLYTQRVQGILPGQFEFVTPHLALKKLALTSIIITALSAVTLVSMNFGLGALYLNTSEKNPIRIASSQGATITFLLSTVYLVLLLAMYFFPVITMHTASINNSVVSNRIFWFVLGLIAGLSGLIIAVSHSIGIASLRKDFL
ncbi:MAG: hypothetical protein H3C35_05210 [Bacteroidetes bacterium]|nr:hypothetical protein [Bacteroidota bacterium]